MPDAFTAGVKPGGLNDSAQIRILLCYLVRSAGPVTRETLEGALLQEELVNWFEMGSALAELEKNGLLCADPQGYCVTPKGATVADELGQGLPLSVRESAVRAVVRIQRWQRKAAVNRAQVESGPDGCAVLCAIGDGIDGGGDLLRLRLALPDSESAELLKNRFIARGSGLYTLLMDALLRPGDEEDEPPVGASL